MLGKKLLEADVEKYFRQQSRKHKIWPVKIYPFNSKGFPDRLCLGEDGLVFFVELKRPEGGKVSPRQNLNHRLLRKLGFDVFVIYTKEQVDTFYETKPFHS